MIENSNQGELNSSPELVNVSETSVAKKVLRNVDARKISSFLQIKKRKEVKVARLKGAKDAFKQILERGYFIVPLDGEGQKSKHQTLDSIDRKSINNKIKELDVQILITSGQLDGVETDVNFLLQKNIKANTDKVEKIRFAKKSEKITKIFTNLIKEANKNGSHANLLALESNDKNQNTTVPEDSLLKFFSKLPKSAKRSLENDSELKKVVIDEISKVMNKL